MVLQNGGLFVFWGGGLEGGADGFYDSLWVFYTAARNWSLLTQEDERGLVGSKRPCARARGAVERSAARAALSPR